MDLRKIPGITVVFTEKAKIFGENYEGAPDPIAATDPTKMEVADPIELDAIMATVARVTDLDIKDIEINGNGKSIRFVGGNVKLFKKFLNDSTHEHQELGRLKQDDPEGILGRKGDELITLDLHAAPSPGL